MLPTGEVKRFVAELKVYRDRGVDPLTEGLDQPTDNLEPLGLTGRNLQPFDRRASTPPLTERIDRSERPNRSLTVTGGRL